MAQQSSEIRYLTAPAIDTKKKKYCRFKKSGIKYIDYKDPEFLKKFLNEQGKILPRRITGTSLKYQRRVAQAVNPFTRINNECPRRYVHRCEAQRIKHTKGHLPLS